MSFLKAAILGLGVVTMAGEHGVDGQAFHSQSPVDAKDHLQNKDDPVPFLSQVQTELLNRDLLAHKQKITPLNIYYFITVNILLKSLVIKFY